MARSLQIIFEKRQQLIFGGFALLFALATLRLVQLQILEGDRARKTVLSRQLVGRDLPAPRGRILDRRGSVMAESIETWNLRVYPVRFRERNRVDALADLVVAFLPERADEFLVPPPALKADFVESRLLRFLTVYSRREEYVAAVLALPSSVAALQSDELKDRWQHLLYPRGELVVPPDGRLRRRLLDALLLVVDDPALATRRALLERLGGDESLGEALRIDARAVVRGMDDEMAELGWLANELDQRTRDEFLFLLFKQEYRARERLQTDIRNAIDDRIAARRFGTYDLRKLDDDELDELARELKIPLDDPSELWSQLVLLRERGSRGELESETERNLLEEFEGVDERSDFDRMSAARRRVLSFNLGLWSRQAGRLKRELGRQTRESEEYSERDYLSTSRKWVRIQYYKGGIPYPLGSGLRFEVADRIWRTFGLRRAGFDILASYGRSYPAAKDGLATMLLGRVTDEGAAIGGLEAVLSTRRDPENPTGPRVDGCIVGQPGRVQRRRQPDGSYEELATSRRPEPGRDVQLSIDLDLQAEVNKILVEMNDVLDGRQGAGAVVIDLRNGDVLAAGSVPLIDSDRYLDLYYEQTQIDRARRALNSVGEEAGMTAEEWSQRRRQLQWEMEEVGLWNRAFEASAYWSPPGSVAKVFSSAALLHFDVFDPDEVRPTWDRGPCDLSEAIYRSSNVYFRDLVRRIGQKKLVSVFENFGLGEPIPHVVSEFGAKRRLKKVYGDRSNNTVIGQGSISVSPLEVASMMARYAGRGRAYVPRLVLRDGDETRPPRKRGEVFLSEAHWNRVTNGMRRVADHYASRLTAEHDLAGKTGTADGFVDERWQEYHQAWFAGFAPARAPRIAFAVTCIRTQKIGKHVAPFAARIAAAALERAR